MAAAAALLVTIDDDVFAVWDGWVGEGCISGGGC